MPYFYVFMSSVVIGIAVDDLSIAETLPQGVAKNVAFAVLFFGIAVVMSIREHGKASRRP